MQSRADTNLLLGHMPLVRGYHNTLCNLGEWWQKVSLIGKINSLQIAATLLEDMENTRRKFETLQHQLIENLVEENLNKQDQELSARAQVAIDILIRNLFERTADVGFLATDDDLRAFLRDPQAGPAEVDQIVARLREYTLKYSVYDEIILLDTEGRVKANLDRQGNPISRSQDRLIQETLNSREPFVETFRHSDLQPGRRHSLIYSARITESNDALSPVLGVLCLCFRFDDEMAGIFANLRKGRELITILDRQGRVIASSDEHRLPLGQPLTSARHNRTDLIKHQDADFFARTATTKGYQGYTGLSWKGHVMMPLKSAFSEHADQGLGEHELPSQSELFSQELRSIAATATRVTDDLILVVLNGQIVSAKRDAKEFMPVLDEIRLIGSRTKGVFEESIANLYGTVISSLLSDVQFQAFLAVDIMDRNLYERANDVRWWALTTRFREILAKRELSPSDRETLSAILAYFNDLYTVYTNLFLFDTQGVIQAVSNPKESAWVGKQLPKESHISAALEVRESQRYVVSPFNRTDLYDGRHTYIYLTAVRDLKTGQGIGGIGIVFDSEPQFAAMLDDALPRDDNGEILAGCFGVFAERSGRVIASTRAELPAGSRLELDASLFDLDKGARQSALIDFQEHKYAVGAAMSQGYREYKTTGDYDNDVLALIFVPV
ncbi:MAG: cache domain-containing protein [Candidatus Thiodiazotropha sp.]